VLLATDGKDQLADRVKNEEVLLRVKKEKTSYIQHIDRRLSGLLTPCIGTVFQNMSLKES
jgi:hypothetical protein